MKKTYLLVITNTNDDKVYQMDSDNISELEEKATEYLACWSKSKYVATIYSYIKVCSYVLKNDTIVREV